MAWIEYHAGLRDHWKIDRLSTELECSYPQALGHISCLWCWCIENAPTGHLKKFTDIELCKAARIDLQKGEARPLKKVLKGVGLLNDNDFIHDWGKHGLKYLESTRKRVREFRLRQRYSNVTVTPTIPTLPTLPNQPKEKTNSAFEILWNKYPNKDGKKAAFRHFELTVRTPEDVHDISLALENYLKSDKVKKGFIKNGSTWFNNWKDWINYKGVNQNESTRDRIHRLAEEGRRKAVSVDTQGAVTIG